MKVAEIVVNAEGRPSSDELQGCSGMIKQIPALMSDVKQELKDQKKRRETDSPVTIASDLFTSPQIAHEIYWLYKNATPAGARTAVRRKVSDTIRAVEQNQHAGPRIEAAVESFSKKKAAAGPLLAELRKIAKLAKKHSPALDDDTADLSQWPTISYKKDGVEEPQLDVFDDLYLNLSVHYQPQAPPAAPGGGDDDNGDDDEGGAAEGKGGDGLQPMEATETEAHMTETEDLVDFLNSFDN